MQWGFKIRDINFLWMCKLFMLHQCLQLNKNLRMSHPLKSIFHIEWKILSTNKFTREKSNTPKIMDYEAKQPSSMELNVLQLRYGKITNCWFGVRSEMLKNEEDGKDQCYYYKASSNYDSWLVKISVCSLIGWGVKLMPFFTHLPLPMLNI